MPHLSALRIYPLKSCAGLDLTESAMERRGLRHDRRWMLVDAEDRFLTQRVLPRMALIDVQLEDGALHLRAPGQEDLIVAPSPPSIRSLESDFQHRVEVWGDQVDAQIANEEVNAWFSRFLGLDCRLAGMPEGSIRPVDPQYGAPGDLVSFADAYPVLLASEASLADLNRRLAEPVTMRRFRPNFVISGTEPFEEDRWAAIRIGAVRFRVVKPCARCQIVNVDPESARTSKEPLRTLATYRTRDGKVYFAQNLIPDGEGVVRVGDEVEVLSLR